MAKIIDSSEFTELVLKSNRKVLVDFFADWCGPCQRMAPIMDELSKEADFDVYKVNVDDSEDLAEEYNIMSIPAMFVFENGKVIKKTVGAMSKEDIIKFVTA